MGHSKGIAARLVLALVLGGSALGCATLVWRVEKAFRSPGERLETFPEAVFEEHGCGERSLPWFRLERHELVPPRVAPGGEFNHRLVYAMCPARATQVVTGTLDTRILFKGKTIVRERVSNYEIKPGRWVVDWFIELPKGAEGGVYALEIQFRSSTVRFDRLLSFAVDSS